MTRRLFVPVNPTDLERYTKKWVPRRAKKPLAVIRGLDVMKRALQSLPPRELCMLFVVRVLRVEQDDVSELFFVRQSNISYRLERAEYRIQLHAKLHDLCSETMLRRALFDVGMNELAVRQVLGVAKTSSQSATAETLEVSQGSIRHTFATAVNRLKEKMDSIKNGKAAYDYLTLIESNYNQLRQIFSQQRFAWKVGDSGYVTAPKKKLKVGEK